VNKYADEQVKNLIKEMKYTFKSKESIAEEVLHNLSIQEQKALHFYFLESRSLQKYLTNILFLLLGFVIAEMIFILYFIGVIML
jgi:hypothetical protein